ncbi:unnamed protein product [Urochloa humidicola]
MAFEDLLQLLARTEAVCIKQAEVMHLVTLATVESLASGEIAPGDPEFAATAARGEAMALEVIRGAAESVAMFARKAAEYAEAPGGGEAVADALRRQADSAAALAALAEKFAAFMRRAAGMPAAAPAAAAAPWDCDSALSEAAARPATIRPRRRNAKYFGPEWTN